MTRFQVRNKLRKAGSKAKAIAVDKFIGQANFDKSRARIGVGKTALKIATIAVLSLAVNTAATSARAATATLTSPTSGGILPGGISPVGGIVLDLIGQNDTRVTSQLAASQLYQGFFANNPGTIGTQTGFNSSVTGALGGGIKEAAIRFTLFDGDTAAGNFDFNRNKLLLNGLNFGDWSNVATQQTDASGNVIAGGFSGNGFPNNILSTGFFYSNNSTLLTQLFDTILNTQQVAYQINDSTPFDNFYDFRQGIDTNLVSIATGPAVQSNPVPEPFTIVGTLAAGGIGVVLRRKSKQQAKDTAQV
jgi:hypothetical protein